MLNGYDVDGVLTNGVIPEEPYVVISGRLRTEFADTIEELGTDAAVYLRPDGMKGNPVEGGYWKAQMITLLGVTEFWEDDPICANIIEATCPGVTLHLVSTFGNTHGRRL